MRSRMYASALALGVWASGCGDPDLATDLNTEGPPEVTAVAVSSESAGGQEVATFCLNGTEHKVNTLLCPESEPGVRPADMVVDALPLGWSTRIVFSELLDPSVEDLEEDAEGNTFGTIAGTQPVTLTCGGAEVAYDGYYDPSGNDVSLPAGPSLLVVANEFVATGTSCSVAVKASVTDKSGNAVPDSMRGPYEFAIAPMALVSSLPAHTPEFDDDPMTGHNPAEILQVMFNAPVDPTTLAGNITLDQEGTDVPVAFEVADADPTIVTIIPQTGALADDTPYTITVGAGITDAKGGEFSPAEPITIAFRTGQFMGLDGGIPDAGDGIEPDADTDADI